MENLLLKKSYLLKDLKSVPFKDLWNSYGIFTTMRLVGKPPGILFYKEHVRRVRVMIRLRNSQLICVFFNVEESFLNR